MKNIFKLMGIALIASSMLLVSCNKDEEEPTPTPTPTPEKTYTLTLKVNDGAMGSVAAVPQKSAYKAGDSVVVTATANPGYKFANWSTGSVENPITVVFDSANITLTASFVTDVPKHMNISFGEYTWATNGVMIAKESANNPIIYGYIFENSQDNTKPFIYFQMANAVGSNYTAGQGNNYFIEYYSNEADTITIDGYLSGGWQPYSFSYNITEIDLNTRDITFDGQAGLYNYIEYLDDPETASTNPLTMDVKTTWFAMSSKKAIR